MSSRAWRRLFVITLLSLGLGLACDENKGGEGSTPAAGETRQIVTQLKPVKQVTGADLTKMKCETKADCALIRGVCGRTWMAVNKAHRETFERDVAKQERDISCKHLQLDPPATACIHELCVVDSK